MPQEKRYRTMVPIEHGADRELARWLARESFEKTAASEGLRIVEYYERDVAVGEIPPKVAEQLGRPATDYDWFEFSGLGRLDRELFDWLAAECAWRTEQTRAWLDAESRAHKAQEWATRQERMRA
jgi:hypothetical protein